MPKNKKLTLYDAIVQLLHAVIPILRKNIEKRPIHDSGFFLKETRDIIVELPESKILEKVMHENSSIRREFAYRISDSERKPVEKPGIGTIFGAYIAPFFSQYFIAAGSTEFIEEIYNPLYFRFEEYLLSDSLSFKVVAPLVGFTSDAAIIELDENLIIRKMEENEIERLWKPRVPYSPFTMSYMDASTLRFTLEHTESRKKINTNKTVVKKPSATNLFEGVITALRLFKTGRVDFFFTQKTSLMWDPYGGITSGSKRERDYFGFRPSYSLTSKEIDEFISFWHEVRTVLINEDYKGHNYLRIAVKRFNFGTEEKELENKILDFFIAYEALYLQDTAELSYRLSLRTATVLGVTSKGKQNIFNFMRDAYILRSKIIHGKVPKIKGKKVALTNVVPQLEEYLRKSIFYFLKLIDQPRKHETVLNIIDADIFN